MFDLIIYVAGDYVTRNMTCFFMTSSTCCFFCWSSVRLVQLLNIGPKIYCLEDFGQLALLDKVALIVLQLFYFIKYGKRVKNETLDLKFFGHGDKVYS